MDELPRKAHKFILENKDILVLLGKKMREIDTVKENRYTKYSEESRRMALEIVEGWISEVWNIAFSREDVYEEENELYRIIEERE